MLVGVYSLLLFKRSPFAVAWSWVIVGLIAIATVLSGLVPLMVGAWVLIFGFTIYLHNHPDALHRGCTGPR